MGLKRKRKERKRKRHGEEEYKTTQRERGGYRRGTIRRTKMEIEIKSER